MSRTKIQSVAPGTPAHQAGVRPGETLLAINGHPIVDVLDYKYYAYDPELVLQLRSEAGERTVELSKDVGEDLGLTFATYLMDRARSCANKCVFCFVDQMPQGMRDTLYFKDDDARLSFLMGNYITLTNLSRRELQRICDLHISPINISVHATDPAVRRLLLGNVHLQIVGFQLCQHISLLHHVADLHVDLLHQIAQGGVDLSARLAFHHAAQTDGVLQIHLL